MQKTAGVEVKAVTEEPQTLLRILRCAPDDVKYREAIIFLNDTEIANLAYGDEKAIKIEPGIYSIRAYNRVLKSKTIDFIAQPGDIVSFEVANVSSFMYVLLMILQMGPPSMRLKMVRKENIIERERENSPQSDEE